MATVEQVLDIARGEIGFCRFSDDGIGTKYSRWYYNDLLGTPGQNYNGVPFCAMGLSWVFNQAGQECAGFPGAYCPWIVNSIRSSNIEVNKNNIKPGDVLLFDWSPQDGVSDHVGIAEKVLDNGTIQTIEFNTTGPDGRSGSVNRRTRNLSTIMCVGRPNYSESPSTNNQPIETPEVQQPSNNPNGLNGIDIFSGDAGINLSIVPCDFVIIKVTGGTSYQNPEWRKQYQDAVANNKLIGFYHYALEKNREGTPQQEADNFLNTLGDVASKGILCYDWEEDVSKGVAYAKEWLDYVYQKTGVKPLIYMSKAICRQYDWSSVANAGYQLWAAQYPNMNQTGYQTTPWTDNNSFGAWQGPIIYQYSGTGRLSGWSGDLDLNIFYGDAAMWNELAGIKSTNSETQENNSTSDTKKEPTIRHDLQVWEYNNNAAQKFWIRFNEDKSFSLRSVSNWLWLTNPRNAVTVTDAQLLVGQGGTDGNQDPQEDQKLFMRNIGGGVYIISPYNNRELALAIKEDKDANGVGVQWEPTNEELKTQRWIPYHEGNVYRLINVVGMKALDAPDGGWYL